MTTQEIFDKVARHLLTQNKQSVDQMGGCSYRGENNTKCAIGCLIDDEHYCESLEGRSMSENNNVKLAVEKSIGEALEHRACRLLGRLQKLHDALPPSSWKQTLEDIAMAVNLSPAVLEEFSDQ